MPHRDHNEHKAVGVSVRGLYKSFGNFEVLKNINLEIRKGEIFVLMGPSGSGKSVLLKNIIGLEIPNEGEVLIEGSDASEEETHDNIDTALVFQSGALLNSISVYDNLALYPREHRMGSEKEIRARVEKILARLSLQDAADKLPAELSGGMKKRVAIARALVMKPQLLLYDEPTSELDPIMAATISEIIGLLRKENNLTSIVVTHDRDLALTIADRVAILFDGSIHTIATPQELRDTTDPKIKEFLYPEIDLENPRFLQN
jgi:phospholipid/cholesterol/gamma-HCH transport system ATP-binding protein